MRITLSPFQQTLPVLILAAACGGKLGADDAGAEGLPDPADAGTVSQPLPGTTTPVTPEMAEQGANGVRLPWRQACERIRAAKLATYYRLHCETVGKATFLPENYCDDGFRRDRPTCEAPYDEGNVAHCEELLQTYTKCEDFHPDRGRPCTLYFYLRDVPDPTTCDWVTRIP